MRIDTLPEWNGGLAAGDDVVIVLRGLSRYEPQPGALNLIWLISHPAAVSELELAEFDPVPFPAQPSLRSVFVASRSYTQRLSRSLGDKVCELLQCTDPAVLRPADDLIPDLPTALFVGNSRKVRRKIVDDAIAAGLDFAVCGGRLGRSDRSKGTCFVTLFPTKNCIAIQASATVVLNDHWLDMQEHEFVSNRLFDADACGAAIVSDQVSGLASVFGDAVRTNRSPAEL